MSWEGKPTPGGWEYQNGDGRIVLDFVRPTSRGLEVWVELWSGNDKIPVVQGQQNIMSPRAAQPFIEGVKAKKGDWAEGLRIAFHQLLVAHREPSETADLVLVEPVGIEWLVEPLLAKGDNTRLIAAGGSGKSIMALALALSIVTGNRKFLGLDVAVTGPVLYLDWEANKETHAQRLHALCGPAGIPLPDTDQLMYQYHAAPLARVTHSVWRTCEKLGAVAVVVDSRVMAAGPSGQSSGEDAAAGLYASLREIARSAVIVDHKTKEDIQKGKRGGYGSVYNQNLARMEWEMTRYSRVSKNKRTFVLSLEKENNVGDLPPIGFEMWTDGGKTGITDARFSRVNPDSILDPGDSNMVERIATLMMGSNEALEIKKIADMLGDVVESSVRACLNNNKGTFENVGKGRRGLWKLMDDYGTDDGFQPPLEVEPPPGVPDDGWDGEVF